MHDPHFARTYLREKEALLDVLARADARLRRMALDRLADHTGIIH